MRRVTISVEHEHRQKHCCGGVNEARGARHDNPSLGSVLLDYTDGRVVPVGRWNRLHPKADGTHWQRTTTSNGRPLAVAGVRMRSCWRHTRMFTPIPTDGWTSTTCLCHQKIPAVTRLVAYSRAHFRPLWRKHAARQKIEYPPRRWAQTAGRASIIANPDCGAQGEAGDGQQKAFPHRARRQRS
jgi:hypothetical protein